MPNAAPTENYYAGLNDKLFAALPPARRVLELGCANGRLGQAYKARHPEAHWTGVDRVPSALEIASRHLDEVISLDLDDLDLDGRPVAGFAEGFDLIVFGDLIEHLKAPRRFLSSLQGLVRENGRLVCCIPNMNHVSVIERLLIGDLSYDPNGLLDDTHLRLFSPASAIKTLLDGGWLPALADSYVVGGDPETLRLLRDCAARLGVSAEAFERSALTYQMIFDCLPATRPQAQAAGAAPSVSIVVPVTNPVQYHLNIARSPGVSELGAQLVPVHGASSAADGFERGKAQATGEWILYCHQDVYLPVGSGHAIGAALAAIGDDRKRTQIVGFVGLAEAPGERFMDMADIRLSGTIIDRIHRMQAPPTLDAISIDECAVALHRESPFRIDPALGWHLWATELIMTAREQVPEPPCRIGEAAVFHNSASGWALDAAFAESRRVLFDKHPDMAVLRSLCGMWRR